MGGYTTPSTKAHFEPGLRRRAAVVILQLIAGQQPYTLQQYASLAHTPAMYSNHASAPLSQWGIHDVRTSRDPGQCGSCQLESDTSGLLRPLRQWPRNALSS